VEQKRDYGKGACAKFSQKVGSNGIINFGEEGKKGEGHVSRGEGRNKGSDL